MYTAIFFDKWEENMLNAKFIKHMIELIGPNEWTRVDERHVTLWMGDCPKEFKGKFVSVIIDAIGSTDKAIAFRVKPELGAALSKNATPHITLFVNKEVGGKPFHSNEITDWIEIEPFELEGEIKEHE